MLERLASFCFRRRRLVVVLWLLALPAAFIVNGAIGGTFATQQGGNLKQAEAQRAFDLLKRSFPQVAEEAGFANGQVVFRAPAGKRLTDPAVAGAVETWLADLRKQPNVKGVRSPFDRVRPGINRDQTVGIATVQLDPAADLQKDGIKLLPLADSLRKQGIQTEFGGQIFYKFALPPSEAFGLLAAVVILLVAFGSVIAMGLPILTALLGVGIAIAIVGMFAAVMQMPNFVTSLSGMIGLGVGIDYVLFILTRYREELHEHEPQRATEIAIGTAGRAVVFAGITVMISMLGMFLIGLEFVRGIAVAGATPVAVIVLASLTLIPALLGFIGRRIDWLSIRRIETRPDRETMWHRWSRLVQRRAWVFAGAGLAFLVVASLPVMSLRLAFGDRGNDPKSTTTRKAYDLIAEGFGPGANGPFLVVVDRSKGGSDAQVMALGAALAKDPGVQFVLPPVTSTDGTVSQLTVIPKTAPQDAATTSLVHRLRKHVIPAAVQGTSLRPLVGGFTASGVDFAGVMGARLPVFIAAVLVLSFLLLMAVFRSILVPLKAVLMNLLSIGAAYGVIVAVFQWGWLSDLVALGKPGPIEPWMPMMLFAIVFGLSMDYEVFLLSKIREEYDHGGDNSTAVVEGLASTARVITAAAAIMVCVFLGFVLGDRSIKLMGLGLATAVFIDATVIRIILVPATMELLGNRNWWFPAWLDRIVPRLNVEGKPAAAPEPALQTADAATS